MLAALYKDWQLVLACIDFSQSKILPPKQKTIWVNIYEVKKITKEKWCPNNCIVVDVFIGSISALILFFFYFLIVLKLCLTKNQLILHLAIAESILSNKDNFRNLDFSFVAWGVTFFCYYNL